MTKKEKAEKLLEAIDEYAPAQVNWNMEKQWMRALMRGLSGIEDEEELEGDSEEMVTQGNNSGCAHMVTIKQAADETGVSYEYIRQRCLRKEIVFTRAGCKYLINREKFIEYLNTGDQEDLS